MPQAASITLHYYSAYSPLGLFSDRDYIRYYAYICYLAQTIYFYNNCDYFLNRVYPNTPGDVNFPCGRKPEHPEKTHHFRHLNILSGAAWHMLGAIEKLRKLTNVFKLTAKMRLTEGVFK